MVIKFIQSDN